MRVQCNDVTCKHEWEANEDDGNPHASNRTKMIICPKCGRYNSHYVLSEGRAERLLELIEQKYSREGYDCSRFNFDDGTCTDGCAVEEIAKGGTCYALQHPYPQDECECYHRIGWPTR